MRISACRFEQVFEAGEILRHHRETKTQGASPNGAVAHTSRGRDIPMSATSFVQDVKTIVVNLVVITCGPMGLWMTYRGSTDWGILQVGVGLVLILLCIVGGVVKKVTYGNGKLGVETHESPFLSWGRSPSKGIKG